MIGAVGGAAARDVLVAAIVGVAGISLVAWFTRRGARKRDGVVRRTAALAARISGLPVWAALPVLVGGLSMLTACFGYYWDVALHIDTGRDAGPFGNPSHWFVLLGLLGITAAGFLSGLVAGSDAPPGAIRLGGLRFPVGGFLIFLCGAFALLGFPLDDLWHRLFGQDVTVWGPTHIQMIAGASVPTLGLWVLLAESSRVEGLRERARRLIRAGEPWVAGAFMIGLSALQSEFDHGVPQFRLLYHPTLIMLAAGIGLVAARVRLGRWGALKAALVFVLIRGAITLIVGPGFGHLTGHFPLYLAEALLVELVAVAVAPARALRFGIAAGAAIGTVGLAAEWSWSTVWMPIPWPAELLPEGILLPLAAAMGGGILGAAIGGAMSGRSVAPTPRWAVAGGLAAAVVCLAVPAPTAPPADVRATVSLASIRTAPDRTAIIEVRLDPPSAADDAEWFHALAWQGWSERGDVSRVVPMRSTGAGRYRSAGPVRVGGAWKSLIRLHSGDQLLALPLHLPRDAAIPAPEVAAPRRFDRSFVADKEVVQREAIVTEGPLLRLAYVTIGVIAAVWLAAVVWGMIRLARASRSPVPSAGEGPDPLVRQEVLRERADRASTG